MRQVAAGASNEHGPSPELIARLAWALAARVVGRSSAERDELKRVEQEHNIVKETLVIFAQPSHPLGVISLPSRWRRTLPRATCWTLRATDYALRTTRYALGYVAVACVR